MKLTESVALLDELGIIEWLSRDIEGSTRLVVNAAADYLFDGQGPFDIRPFIESEYVHDYFSDNSWEVDWFGLLGHEFVEAVELNINSIVLSINDLDPLMSVKDTEDYVVRWVHEWQQKARQQLRNEMQEYSKRTQPSGN